MTTTQTTSRHRVTMTACTVSGEGGIPLEQFSKPLSGFHLDP